MKNTLRKFRTLKTLPVAAALAMLAVFSVVPANAQSTSLCGNVMNGAILNFAYECWNDAEFLVSQQSKIDGAGWQYTADGGVNDNAGPEFDARGMAFHETKDEVWVVINSTMPFDTGYVAPTALNGTVTFGDMFLNLSNLNFVDAMNAGKLYGIRFDSKNDASVPLGVYKSVTGLSVAGQNLGPGNRQGYETHIYAHSGVPGYGDFATNMTYYALSAGYNVIGSGQYLGAVTLVTGSTLLAEGYDPTHFSGPDTVGFKFKKSLIIDACGVIGGDGSSCTDCAGIACGQTVVDQCGVCGGNGTSCLDCLGTPNGQATIDQCGVCGGNGTSCLDCSGKPFGTKVSDRCGACGGDGMSCLGCSSQDISPSLFTLDGSSVRQAKLLTKAAKELLRKAGKSSSIRKFAKDQIKAANKLHLENWTLSWTLPQVVTTCTNTTFCVSTDNSATITKYNGNANELYSRTSKTVSRLRKSIRNKKAGSNIIRAAKAELGKALGATSQVPSASSKCS